MAKGKIVRWETIYFNFRLDFGGSNLNHVNEFVPKTKLTNENEISEKTKSQSTLSKTLRKSKEITARGLPSLSERSIESHITERVCNMVHFLIAIN